MSLLERRAKKGITGLTLATDTSLVSESSNSFDSETTRESIDYGDVHVKSNGTISFSKAYPVVTLRDLKFEEQLGSGVQGTVYRCIHIPSGKEVAVKSIRIQDKSHIQKIVDEIHSLHILRHTNVVNLFSAFSQKGFIHILMDYVNGASLGDYIQYVPIIPEPALNEIAEQLLHGLKYIVKQHIVHRDLKPSNIMVSRDGHIKIADFGMARQLRCTSDFATSIKGTTCYMSPERINAETYGLKSDVWSLGVILYQCCIGHYPFGGKSAGFWDINFEDENDFSVELGPGYSNDLVDFIKRCLVVDTKQRASFEELSSHKWITDGGGPGAKDALLAWVSLADGRRKVDLDAQRRSREALYK